MDQQGCACICLYISHVLQEANLRSMDSQSTVAYDAGAFDWEASTASPALSAPSALRVGGSFLSEGSPGES